MNQFAFNPPNGFLDASAFPDPSGETDTREQLFELHKQTRDYINDNLAGKVVQSDTVVAVKGNQVGFSYSTDGETFIVVGGGGGGGSGDMLTSVYDTNADGIVNGADTVNGHTVLSDVPADAVFTDTWAEDKTDVLQRFSAVDGMFTVTLASNEEFQSNTVEVFLPASYDEYLIIIDGHYNSSSEFAITRRISKAELNRYGTRRVLLGVVTGGSSSYGRAHLAIVATTTNSFTVSITRNQNGYTLDKVSVYGR